MNPNFLDFVRLGKRAGYPKVQTVTNGRMFNYPDFLDRAAKKKHPNRPEPRSYPRQAHTRRQKSTKFEKAQRRKNADEQAAKPLK